METGHLHEAMPYLERVIGDGTSQSERKSVGDLYLSRGMCRHAIGSHGNAVKDLSKAADIYRSQGSRSDSNDELNPALCFLENL